MNKEHVGRWGRGGKRIGWVRYYFECKTRKDAQKEKWYFKNIYKNTMRVRG